MQQQCTWKIGAPEDILCMPSITRDVMGSNPAHGSSVLKIIACFRWPCIILHVWLQTDIHVKIKHDYVIACSLIGTIVTQRRVDIVKGYTGKANLVPSSYGENLQNRCTGIFLVL